MGVGAGVGLVAVFLLLARRREDSNLGRAVRSLTVEGLVVTGLRVGTLARAWEGVREEGREVRLGLALARTWDKEEGPRTAVRLVGAGVGMGVKAGLSFRDLCGKGEAGVVGGAMVVAWLEGLLPRRAGGSVVGGAVVRREA